MRFLASPILNKMHLLESRGVVVFVDLIQCITIYSDNISYLTTGDVLLSVIVMFEFFHFVSYFMESVV